MNKHVYFWVGAFSAALIAIPVGLMVWGAATDRALSLATFLFGSISALILVILIIAMFRDRILRKILKTSEVHLDQVSEQAISFVSGVIQRDQKRIESEAKNLTKTVSAWWIWSNFYRWVIGTALALLLTFGAFTGTVLLFEQTKKISEQTTQFSMQNDLMSLSLVSELRDQMLKTIREVDAVEYIDSTFFETNGSPESDSFIGAIIQFNNGCGLTAAQGPIGLLTPPSDSTLAAIKDIARRDLLSDRVIRALENLLLDDNSAVAYGAAKVLIEMDHRFSLGEVEFDGLLLESIPDDPPVILRFNRSLFYEIYCDSCRISMSNSLEIAGLLTGEIYVRDTLFSGMRSQLSFGAQDIYRSIDLLPWSDVESNQVRNGRGNVFLSNGETLWGAEWTDFGRLFEYPDGSEEFIRSDLSNCSMLDSFEKNPFVTNRKRAMPLKPDEKN